MDTSVAIENPFESFPKRPDTWTLPLILPSRPNYLISDEAELVTQLEASQIEDSIHFAGWERVLYHYYACRYPAEIQSLREGGILGLTAYEDKAAWFNVAGHSFLVAIVAQSVAQLAGADSFEIEEVARVGLVHDVEKRHQKEFLRSLPPAARAAALTRFEEGAEGLFRVTGAVLNDYEGYNLKELALRFADSSVGMHAGKERFISWSTRIAQLKERDSGVGHSQDVGKRYYGGRSFYDVLGDVTAFCEAKLHEMVLERTPGVQGQCLPGELLGLVVSNISKIIQEEVKSLYHARASVRL